jgi:hypothetical protein
MQPDLESLYITREELKNITGIHHLDLKAYEKLKYPRLTLSVMIGEYVQQILFLGWGLIPIGYLIKWKWFRKRQKNLFDEVDKYNTVVKAIDISDRLEAAGNKGASLRDREKIIAALKHTRENLMCALKTERILRENKKLIARNPELFANNLTVSQSLQIIEEANEQGRLLSEALQVAVGVQEEMKDLEEEQN